MDTSYVLPHYGREVCGVCHVRVVQYVGRVGVHQIHPVTLFSQRFTGLGPGVVKFASLANDNGAGSNNQNTFDVGTFWHGFLTCAKSVDMGSQCSAGATHRFAFSINSIKWSNSPAASWGPGLTSG